MAVQKHTLRSTFITEVQYDSKGQRLIVVMKDGDGGQRAYAYQGVSRGQAYRMRKHKSPGRYYSRCIKGRKPMIGRIRQGEARWTLTPAAEHLAAA